MDGYRQLRRAAAAVLLAGITLAGSGCFHEAVAPADLYVRDVSGNVFDTTPVRGEYQPLRNRRTGFEYKCSECHTEIKSPTRQQDMQGEHKAIYDAFDHGLNTRCINCHHQTDRNAYVDHDGEPIPAEQPARLCAKCHGPTYRDWEAGVHGRSNGYWKASMGEKKRLLCVQCHDPHSPKFKPMTPDPAPPYTRLQARRPDTAPAHEEGTHP